MCTLERAGNPETGNPIQFVWSKVGNYAIDGNRITADVLAFEPTLYHEFAVASATTGSGITRQAALRRMLRPFKQIASQLS